MAVAKEILQRNPIISRYEVEIGMIKTPKGVTPRYVPVAPHKGEKVWYKQVALATDLLLCYEECRRNRLITDCHKRANCSLSREQWQQRGFDTLRLTPNVTKEFLGYLLDDAQDRGNTLVLGAGAWIERVMVQWGISRQLNVFLQTVDWGVWKKIDHKKEQLFIRRNNGALYHYSTRLVQVV